MDRPRIPTENIETSVDMIRVNFSLNAPFEGVAIIQMTDQFECSFKYSNFDSLDAFSFRRTFFLYDATTKLVSF